MPKNKQGVSDNKRSKMKVCGKIFIIIPELTDEEKIERIKIDKIGVRS